MSGELTDKAKQKIIGRHPDWIKQFDPSEYVSNRPMIEKLYEEKQMALATALDFEKRVDDLSSQVHELELRNQRLSLQLGETKWRAFIGFILSLSAAICIGLGVNIASDQPYEWIGWVLIAIAVMLELATFWLTRPQ